MKKYKMIASKIERFKHADYVKARIYLEIQEFESEVDIDALVQAGFNAWENSDSLSPEDIGAALWAAIQYLDETDPEEMVSKGLDFIR
jgi:hypothetical protein